MTLIDRLAHDTPGSETDISNHEFSAAVWFWAQGDITQQNVVDAFTLTAEDEVQLDQLRTHYQNLGANQKLHFHSDLEAAGMLLEGGKLTKAQYKNLLGLS